uniref:GmrSD restriction endonucleases N-terminal domain-containing protein n=1 Tax=viral metagenome TaxID=1070528 RepID=A0A6M3KYT6_9ZZZZ
MGIGMDRWRFEVSTQGPTESWDWLTERVYGDVRRVGRDDYYPRWILNPDYQRGPVWTYQQQSRFIGHVLAGGVQQPIYVQRYRSKRFSPVPEYWTVPEEVIDGQQRLRAIAAFMTGQRPAEVWHDEGWHSYWLRDMDKRESGFTKLASTVVYVDVSRADRLRFYLRLNGGGVPHTEEDLGRVRKMLADETGMAE